jgi:hypothetical protein
MKALTIPVPGEALIVAETLPNMMYFSEINVGAWFFSVITKLAPLEL